MPPSFTPATNADAASADAARADAASADATTAILDEAADWMVLLNDAQVSDADRRAWMDWRARSPAHEAAWQRAERLLARMRVLPPPLAMPALDRPAQPRRRAALAKLAALALAAPAGWAAWQVARDTGWASEYRTATGERREAVNRSAEGIRERPVMVAAAAINAVCRFRPPAPEAPRPSRRCPASVSPADRRTGPPATQRITSRIRRRTPQIDGGKAQDPAAPHMLIRTV